MKNPIGYDRVQVFIGVSYLRTVWTRTQLSMACDVSYHCCWSANVVIHKLRGHRNLHKITYQSWGHRQWQVSSTYILSSGSDSIIMAVHRILLTHVARSKLRYIRTARPAWILSVIRNWEMIFPIEEWCPMSSCCSWRTIPERQFIL